TKTAKRGVIGNRGPRSDLISEGLSEPTISSDPNTNVVVFLFGKERSPEMLIEIGIAIANSNKLGVIKLTEIPEQINIDDLNSESVESTSIRRRTKTIAEKLRSEIEFEAVFTHDIYKVISEITNQLHCKWLIKEWGGRTRGAITFHRQIGWLENRLHCHVLTVRDAGIRYIQKILVYLD